MAKLASNSLVEIHKFYIMDIVKHFLLLFAHLNFFREFSSRRFPGSLIISKDMKSKKEIKARKKILNLCTDKHKFEQKK